MTVFGGKGLGVCANLLGHGGRGSGETLGDVQKRGLCFTSNDRQSRPLKQTTACHFQVRCLRPLRFPDMNG